MTGSSAPPPSYFTAPEGLRWEEIDDAYLVFNPLSDEIHHLNPLAAAALAELEERPLDIDQLESRLDVLMGDACSDQLHEQLGELIRQFDEIGLVARVQQPTPPA